MAHPAFVAKLVPKKSIRANLYMWQVRRKIRYQCFSLGNPDNDHTGVPKGFKSFYEKQEFFDGWENFGKTWDVGGDDFVDNGGPEYESDDPLVVVPRWLTVWEENEDEMDAQMKINEIEARKRRRGSQTNSKPSN